MSNSVAKRGSGLPVVSHAGTARRSSHSHQPPSLYASDQQMAPLAPSLRPCTRANPLLCLTSASGAAARSHRADGKHPMRLTPSTTGVQPVMNAGCGGRSTPCCCPGNGTLCRWRGRPLRNDARRSVVIILSALEMLPDAYAGVQSVMSSSGSASAPSRMS